MQLTPIFPNKFDLLKAIFKNFCLFFMLLFITALLFADEDRQILAVMELEDKSGKLSAETLSNATEYIRGACVASNQFIVIAKERQENAMIKQMKKESYKACNDQNCQIPLGKALSADTILTTKIIFFAGVYTLSSELIDLEKEVSTKGAKETFDGSEKSLKKAIDSILAQITDKKQQKHISQKSSVSADKTPVNTKNSSKSKSKWSQKTRVKMRYSDALNYCKKLKEDDFRDWRLPNIDELRTLVINHSGTKTGGNCKISEKTGKLSVQDWIKKDCEGRSNTGNHSKLGDTGWFWSSSAPSNHPMYRWLINFGSGEIQSNLTNTKSFVRCIRNTK